jgi:ankyrin repeat protein
MLLLHAGCTSLHWAAGSNKMEVIRYLVEDRLVPVDIRATKKARGRTPLHYACRNGMLQSAKLMVELGADVDARAKHDVSPFQLAVWQNHLDVCKWLVRVVHVVSFLFLPHHRLTLYTRVGGGTRSGSLPNERI